MTYDAPNPLGGTPVSALARLTGAGLASEEVDKIHALAVKAERPGMRGMHNGYAWLGFMVVGATLLPLQGGPAWTLLVGAGAGLLVGGVAIVAWDKLVAPEVAKRDVVEIGVRHGLSSAQARDLGDAFVRASQTLSLADKAWVEAVVLAEN